MGVPSRRKGIVEGERDGSRGSGVAELLLARVDSIGDLIERDRFAEAREALNGRKWLGEVETGDLPPELIRRAQQWIDAGHDALGGSEPDAMLARNILIQLRRVLQG